MGQKDKILDDVKRAEAKRDGLKIEDYQKKATEKYAADKDAEKGVVNNAYDTAKVNAQATHDKAVNDTNIEYESQYERNAVQKLINEKQVAEKMANLGLTDGGLNRTQQTAVQLSYANQKGKLDLAKRSALDGLSLNLTSALREIETNRNIDLFEVDQKWKDRAYSEAQTNYNNDVANYNSQIASGYEQYGKIAEAEIEAETKRPTVMYGAGGTSNGNYILKTSGGLLSRDFTGSLADNNINVIYNNDGTTTYVDNNSGKKTTLDSDINPYTGTRNNDTDDGVFANGYQPDNVKGEKLKKVKGVVVSVKGNNQSVWYANGVYYVWDGANNKYQKLTRKQIYDLRI